jgi:hypothetical protein
VPAQWTVALTAERPTGCRRRRRRRSLVVRSIASSQVQNVDTVAREFGRRRLVVGETVARIDWPSSSSSDGRTERIAVSYYLPYHY